MAKLFCFGLGFSALTLARQLRADGWFVSGTCRTTDMQSELSAQGIPAYLFDGTAPLPEDAAQALRQADHLLVSIPSGPDGDPAIIQSAELVRQAAPGLRWAGYLSTTGVYGDTDGAEVTEQSPLNPSSPRSEYRIAAERAWLDLAAVSYTHLTLPTKA